MTGIPGDACIAKSISECLCLELALCLWATSPAFAKFGVIAASRPVLMAHAIIHMLTHQEKTRFSSYMDAISTLLLENISSDTTFSSDAPKTFGFSRSPAIPRLAGSNTSGISQ